MPIIANDEVGDLSVDFNRVRQTFEELATAVEAVAAGDLSVSIAGAGDLTTGFAAMIEQLHDVVSQLRETSVSLARATAEIQAAAGEQQIAATLQNDRVHELEGGMDSLADLASKIDDAGKGVLANAERALSNSTGVREVAEILAMTTVATEQTRAIAEGLQDQAAALERQLAKFELRDASRR